MKNIILKSVIYTFILRFIMLLITGLYINGNIEDIAFFVLSIAAPIISLPAYFFVKGNTDRHLTYLILTSISYVLLGAACFGICNIICEEEWDILAFWFAERNLAVMLAVIVFAELVNSFLRRFRRQKTSEKYKT